MSLGSGSSLDDKSTWIKALEADIIAMTAEQKRDFLFHPTTMFIKGEVLGYYDEWICVQLYTDSNCKISVAVSPEICPAFYPYVESAVIEANIKQKLIDGTYEGYKGGDVDVSD